MAALLSSPTLGLVFLAVVLAVVVALHLWRPRPRRQVVASTWLWELAARRTGGARSPWRWWLALALALAIAGMLALALSRPGLQGFGDGTRRIVLLVDNGPSMATHTRDGQTRWQHALARAREVILAAPGEVMVLDSAGEGPVAGFADRDTAQTALAQLRIVPVAVTTFPALPRGADIELHVVSDGVAPVAPPADAVIHSVFEPADNVAVIRLTARPSPEDPTRIEALVQVVNASPAPKAVRLTLRGGEGFSVVQTLTMAADERIDATFDVSAFPGGVLAAAAIAPGDALPDDDIAYTVVPVHRAWRVRLVTPGNAALADALASLAGVRVETVTPGRYRPAADVDAYVFDGFAPAQPPPTGALLFRPTVVAWLPAPDRQVATPVLAAADRSGALADGVPWEALGVRRAALWSRLPAGVEPVVRAGDAVVLAAGRAGAPWIAAGFLPSDSDLPLQPAFPVFLARALARLTAGDTVRTEPVGPVRVALAGAEVRNGRGERVESRAVPGAILFDAARPDLYTVSAGSTRMRVAAALLDPRRAEVNRSRLPPSAGSVPATAGPAFERWTWIVLACVALLLVDWAAFTRRISR